MIGRIILGVIAIHYVTGTYSSIRCHMTLSSKIREMEGILEKKNPSYPDTRLALLEKVSKAKVTFYAGQAEKRKLVDEISSLFAEVSTYRDKYL